ncbi:MAG: hypothetical protein WB524_08625 [Acidobacteriaceae bacterium]
MPPQLSAYQVEDTVSNSQTQADAAKNGTALNVPGGLRPYGFCTQAIGEQKKLGQWVTDALSGIKATDILVAIFTFFLVLVGRRQVRISIDQKNIGDRQTDIAARQLITQGPFLEYSMSKLEIKSGDIARGVLGDWKISLILKNSGRDVATNVGYTQGPIFRITGTEDPILKDATGEHFANTIFRSERARGIRSVGTDATVETDQITLYLSSFAGLIS